jgi:hypothetical protein
MKPDNSVIVWELGAKKNGNGLEEGLMLKYG